MPNVIISTDTTAAILIDDDEHGLITATGGIFNTSSSAVSMAGTANLTVLGSIVGNFGNNFINGSNCTFPTITIGRDGSVINTANTAIGMSVSDHMFFDNAGTVRGEVHGVSISASDDATNVDFSNHGRIYGRHFNGVNATIGTGTLNLFNTGEISGGENGIGVESGTLILRNTGTVGTLDSVAISTSPANDRIHNAGTILGDVGLGAGANRIANSGSLFGNILLGENEDRVGNVGVILGDIALGDGADRFDNTGSIVGDISLDGEADRFDSSEGRFTGSISGGDGNDDIRTDMGSTTISGGEGDDVLEGGRRGDRLFGDSGIDTVLYTGSDKGISVDLLSGIGQGGEAAGDTIQGVENIVGSASQDFLFGNIDANLLSGGLGQDEIFGRKGNDILRGEGGADVLNGGIGRDTADYSTSGGGIAVDLKTGAAVGGDAFGDILTLIENLVGSSEADRLTGNDGANVLSGTGGTDTLTGGLGVDTFVFASGFGIDRVADFSQAADLIDLTGFALGSLAEVEEKISVIGNDLAITFGGGDILRLVGLSGLDPDALLDRLLI